MMEKPGNGKTGTFNLINNPILGKVLFPGSEIQARISELGKIITADYTGKDLLLVSVLRGSVIFLTDLIRRIDLESSIDFMSISSYAGGKSVQATGVVKITKDLEDPIEGRDILIIEDIIDTGLTISYLVRNLKSRNPNSLEVCTLLDRNVKRIAEVRIKYAGFTIGDEYVVGYGLDYKQNFRNLDSIYRLNTTVIKKDIELMGT
jgi:hypoxanthine phosphoribosyltransferase